MIVELIKLVLVCIMGLLTILNARMRDEAPGYAANLELYMQRHGLEVPEPDELEAAVNE